jgi:Phosphoglucomutase/phosphomannomutase, alpha/beta/alpha domain III/Phosphoglucomutase/phosphomannomutase, C-terminal domain
VSRGVSTDDHFSPCGQARRTIVADQRAPAGEHVLHGAAGSSRARAGRRIRNLRASRLRARSRIQRDAHPRHHAGDLPLSQAAGHRRTALHRHGYARAFRAGFCQRVGVSDSTFGFGSEESSGATFLRRDGAVWTTDKDGPVPNLLAAEITARTGKDPGEHYRGLTAELGTPFYTRIDAPATPEQKSRLERLSPDVVATPQLAGEPIRSKLTRAPGNKAAIGGLKVVTDGGWFAARRSGTENIYKIYAESFKEQAHLDRIMREAQEIVNAALASSAGHSQRSSGAKRSPASGFGGHEARGRRAPSVGRRSRQALLRRFGLKV